MHSILVAWWKAEQFLRILIFVKWFCFVVLDRFDLSLIRCIVDLSFLQGWRFVFPAGWILGGWLISIGVNPCLTCTVLESVRCINDASSWAYIFCILQCPEVLETTPSIRCADSAAGNDLAFVGEDEKGHPMSHSFSDTSEASQFLPRIRFVVIDCVVNGFIEDEP